MRYFLDVLIFKIESVLANTRSYEFRDMPNIDLNTYYQQIWAETQKQFRDRVALFDVVQLSDHSHIAKSMPRSGTSSARSSTGIVRVAVKVSSMGLIVSDRYCRS